MWRYGRSSILLEFEPDLKCLHSTPSAETGRASRALDPIPEFIARLDWAYAVGPLLALLHIFYPPWIHCEDGRANFPGSEIIVQWAHLSSYPGSEMIIQCARLYSHEPTVLALRWARLPSYPGSEMIVQCACLSSYPGS